MMIQSKTETALKQIENLQMERQKLLSSTQKYKEALEGQAESLKKTAISLAIQGVVFGAVAVTSFLIVRAFQKKPKVSLSADLPLNPRASLMSGIYASIQGYIASFLLALVREKLTEFLEKKLIHNHENPAKPDYPTRN